MPSVSIAPRLERQDIAAHAQGNGKHGGTQPPGVEYQHHTMKRREPQQRQSHYLGAQRYAAVLAETAYVRTEISVPEKPSVSTRRTAKEHRRRKQKKGRGGQQGQKYACNSQHQRHRTYQHENIFHAAKIITRHEITAQRRHNKFCQGMY